MDHLKNAITNTFDIFALLLILAINDKNRKALMERGCSALESYFSRVDILLWPKFEELFDFHLKPLQTCQVLQFKKIEKAATTKVLTDRFVDFIVSIYRLYIHFPDKALMMEKRLQTFRRAFLELILKGRPESERESEGFGFYLSVLEQIHNACTNDPIVSNFKEFHVYQVEL
jgi:hypothetical protein